MPTRFPAPTRILGVCLVCALLVTTIGVTVQPAAATHTDAWGVTQGDACYRVTPLGDGSQTVEEFYDYRALYEYKYSSYGTTDLQQSQVSQVMLYDGSDGTALVMLHDKLNDGQKGGVATVDISGLPPDGDWAVEDDAYQGRDDNFTHTDTTTHIEWFWSANRTDGAAFVGLGRHDYDTITVDPGFNEDADYWDSSWPWSTNRTIAWKLRRSPSDIVTLDMDEPISIRRGGCPGSPPTAALSAPAEASVGDEITLDASGSSDDGGIVAYRWDVDGDGDIDTTTNDATLTHSYDEIGTVEPSVTVVDSGGATDTASASIELVDETPPTARIDAPAEAITDSDVTLSAANSTDNGAITSYDWTLGDGTNATGETVSHRYESNGTYTVSLTVTDAAGNTDTATDTILVREPDTEAPDASLVVPGEVTVQTNVTLDASTSSDNREIARYEWDVDGDGSVDRTTTDTATITHVYDELGSVRPTVTVVDGAGNENSSSVSVNVTDPEDPDASFSSPDEALTTDTIQFSAANSTDNFEITDYEWDFGDGTNATGQSVSHRYESNGTYTVTLTVTDPAGNTDTATADIVVREPDTTAPTARLDAPESVQVGTNVTLDGSATTENREIARYEWDVDGDGNVDRTTTTEATITVRYDELGTVSPRLTVVDGAGNENTTSLTVNVTDTVAPTASLSAPDDAITTDTVELSAANSTDDFDLARYDWTLGDGTNVTGETVSHRYETNGTYTVTLTVTDAAGNTDTVTADIVVREPDTTAPTARLDVPGRVQVGTNVTLDASASTDDREIARYEWDVDGDGDIEQTTTDTATITHVYDELGTVQPSVKVVDEAGNENTTSVTVNVTDSTPPTASLAASARTVIVGDSVSLDAGNSTDNYRIASYEWALGDGTNATGESVTHSYGTNGTYEVVLTVTDADGNTDTATADITVREPDTTAPTARLDVPGRVQVGTNVTLDASASTDNREIVSYEWDFGDDTTGTGETVTHTYGTNGTYTVTLTVTDAADNTNTTTAEVRVVTDAQPPAPDISVDAKKIKPGKSVFFNGTESTDNRGITRYVWNFDDGSSSEEPSVSHAFNSTGTYRVELTVYDAAGLNESETVKISVKKQRGGGGEPPSGGGGGPPSGGGGLPGGGGLIGGGDDHQDEPDDPPRLSMTTEITSLSDTEAIVETRYARVNKRASVRFGSGAPISGPVRLERFSYLPETDSDRLTVPVSLRRLGPGDGGNGLPNRSVAVVSYGDDDGLRQVQRASVRFSIAPAGGPRAVDFYRQTASGWKQFQPREVRRDGKRSVYAVSGSNRGAVAVAVRTPDIGVRDVSLSTDHLTTVDTLGVRATLHNAGGLAAGRNLTLAVDGKPVDSRTVSVTPEKDATVAAETQFDEPGTHTVSFAGETFDVTVEAAEPSLSLAELTLDNSSIRAGDTVTIRAVVRNTGELPGTYAANLTMFGEEITTRRVRVEPGSTRTLTFEETIQAPGEYVATVGNRTATVTVSGTNGSESGGGPTGESGPGFGFLATALAAAFLVLVALRRRD